MPTLQYYVASVIGQESIGTQLAQLCEKLHPERIEEIDISKLKEEIFQVNLKEPKYFKGLVLSIENKIKIENNINSTLLFCLGLTDELPKGPLKITTGSPPDIDFDTGGRERTILYLEERYGKDRVARVGSINFLRTKSAIKDVGRVLGKEFSFTEELTDLVPPPVAGLWESFEKETEVEPALLLEKYEDIIDPVKNLWGVTRSFGTHAGGVAIAPRPINTLIPLYKDKDGNPVSQFDWRDLEAAGLIKFDILGLLTLEVIQLCLEYLENDQIIVNIDTLEDEDKDTYDLICSGDLEGVFQLGGSESIKQLTVSLAPKNIEDLSMITALFRPGPLSAKMPEIAIAVKQGTAQPTYLHESLKPILENTCGACIYQEQIIKICTDVCGYTAAEADNMRKIMGKKLQDKMAEEKPKFIDGAVLNGVPQSVAAELFSQLKGNAQYLFNKSHSIAYSRITYITAYLKAHYPIHYYAALLASEKKPDKIIQFASSIKEAGISILAPDVNLSGLKHRPEGKAIRFGLSHIKGMPTATAEEIIRIRDEEEI